MSASRARQIVTDWNTIRYELLNTRICDMRLEIAGSPLAPLVRKVRKELAAKQLRYKPHFYLTDSWGCPDEVPAVGIPFYLADRRLARIEEEQTGEIEDPRQILMYLRHEIGHAINYAYRLWTRPGWDKIFGPFTKPYRDVFRPDPYSHDFVRHILHSTFGRTYAQKHPDEDFAETFAVWLTPRSGWRRKYRQWPAMRKLRYVGRLMRDVHRDIPRAETGKLLRPVEEMDVLLADHYGQRTERYRVAAQGYVDDKLKEVFPETQARETVEGADLIRRHWDDLSVGVTRWSGLEKREVDAILSKLEERARELRLTTPRSRMQSRLMDITSLATALAMDFVYTGRFTV